VATALGVLLGVNWVLGLATAATWLIVAFFFRYSSLAALLSAVFVPAYYVFGDGVAWNLEKPILFTLSLMSLLLIFRHAENIGRLARGTESKIGKKKPTP
jgi:glycerol-3-phosphate acyltransferase PlsY